MTDLHFEVLGARPEAHAAVPTVMFRLKITESGGGSVHAVALRCQIRIEPKQRRYGPEEEERLYELFGDAPQWGDSLHPFLWTHVSETIHGFVGSKEVDLPVECSYDFEIAAAKYFHSLKDGGVPLILLFSGTVFTKGESGFTVEPVSWNQEARYLLPVSVWREMMDMYFPNQAWLRIRRDTLDGLQRYKTGRAFPTWDQTFEQLLKEGGEDGP